MRNKLLIFAIALLIAGCASRREKSITYMQDNPEELAKLCALHFKPVVEYKPGKVVHVSDTVLIDGEPIPCPPNEKGEVVYVKGRDKIIRDTIRITDTAMIRDTAKEAELSFKLRGVEDKNIALTQRLQTAKKQRNVAYWALGVLGIIGVGWVLVRRYI